MNDTIYLVDNNALVALGRARCSTRFFRTYCRVTEDVLYEARFHPDLQALELVRYDVGPSVLEKTRLVMNALVPGDTELIDLYKAQGAADPVLIATALEAAEQESERLIQDEWVIVSRDKAVLALAAQYGVGTRSPDQLTDLIDASTR